MRYGTILFDLDGTLIDQFQAIHRCHAHTLARLGLPAPTLAEVRAAVGAGLDAALVRLAGPDRVEEARPIFSDHWDATMLDDVELMPGARELLEPLRAAEVVCAVITNKSGDSARLVCQHLGLMPFLAGVFGAHDSPWLKPDARFTRWVLTALAAAPKSTCLVGDSPYDVETARHAGLDFVGVTTGTHSEAQLRDAGAETVRASLKDAGKVLIRD